MTLTEGSLCTGYNGLGMAVESVLDTTLTWVAEIDRYASALLSRRYPEIPNLGDLKAIDWATVSPVDVLTAGYPCQPFSQAGKREGSDDPRHLWPFIRDAIGVLRPRLVVLENVRGHLTLGFEQVLADLHALGFDAEWALVRASDVGACHQRARLFILAVQHADLPGPQGTEPESSRGSVDGSPGSGGAPPEPGGPQPGGNPRPVPRTLETDGRTGVDLRSALNDRLAPADSKSVGEPDEQGGSHGDPLTFFSVPGTGDRTVEGDSAEGIVIDRRGPGELAWGVFAAAIERHELILGRCAPSPTDGAGRLNPVFVEWMMMLPEGWVTDVEISRAQQLKILGNGVVPAQAAYAVTSLFGRLLGL